MTTAEVALVLVSHSARLADGLVEVAQQMAPDVLIRAAGGIDDDRIGTSYERVEQAALDLLAADGVASVVLLTDLGSATLTADAVLEGLDDPRVSLAEGPFVEGAVAGAVAAQTGGDAADVRRAVLAAGAEFARLADESSGDPLADVFADESPNVSSATPGLPAPGTTGWTGSPIRREPARTVVLRNRLGLHARPAAVLARAVAGFDASVWLNGVPAGSVLELMSLGLPGGSEVRLEAAGPQAAVALDAVVALVEAGFGED